MNGFIGGIGNVGGHGLFRPGFLREAGAALRGADAVNGAVANQNGHPTGCLAKLGIEAAGFFPNLDEDFLQDILSLPGVVEDFRGDGKHQRGMTVVEFPKRRAITGGDLPQQFNVAILGFQLVHRFG